VRNQYPLVSILIPVYNADKYLHETLESLINQSYSNIEIILVDDGSKDNSLSLLKHYENKYDNIIVLSQENSGAQVARNKAFELSKGSYIQYFDADDIMHKDKIKCQIEELKVYDFQENIVATSNWAYFTDEIKSAFFPDQIINKSYDDKFLFFKEAWENSQSMIGQGWLISRVLHEKVGVWNINLTKNQDGEFFTRVTYHSKKIVFVKESIVYYRRDISTSISMSNNLKAIRSHLDSYRIYEMIVKDDIKNHSLHRGVASLYSLIYRKYYPLDNKTKKEVLELLNNLGYKQPLVEFSKSTNWIVKIFGVDTGLYLRNLKTKVIQKILRK